jgi:hypothetical protein
MGNKRKTGRLGRAQWRRLVGAWRRSGVSAGEFAEAHDLVVGTLRWWAWRLGQDGDLDAATDSSGVELLPVRIVETDDGQEHSPDGARLAWALHTPHGELSVYASVDPGLAQLRATISALLGAAK